MAAVFRTDSRELVTEEARRPQPRKKLGASTLDARASSCAVFQVALRSTVDGLETRRFQAGGKLLVFEHARGVFRTELRELSPTRALKPWYTLLRNWTPV